MTSNDINIVYDGSVSDRVAYMKYVLPSAFHSLINREDGSVFRVWDKRDTNKVALVNRAASAYVDSVDRVSRGEQPVDMDEARFEFASVASSFIRKREVAFEASTYVPRAERRVGI